MPTPLRALLDHYRSSARSQREKGTYFERLTKIWLEHAPTQAGRYARVLTYTDFGRERGESGTDTGIDLVAELADDPGRWCAIQCKFYAEGYRLQRSDIDGFLAASARAPFARRMFVDTTGVNWTDHAETTFRDQAIETQRVGLTELEESGIDWSAFAADGTVRLTDKKRPRPDQIEAIDCVTDKLATADRGKLIMACGTGKTFTGLKIAEAMAGRGGRVLFLVPSLALMQQTVREWSIDSEAPLRSFAVCSDAQVGVRRGRDDTTDIDAHDLEIPATTNASVLAAKATIDVPERMTVIFSTYQSLPTIAVAQEKFGLPAFDLIICDEAHRTTGVTLSGEDESNFVRVHDATYIRAAKRLYMTATPRVYGEAVRDVARDENAALVSMDDPALYGETLFTRSFGWAVQNDLLTDYKVIVLAINEADVAAGLQARLADDDSALVLDDATKLVGCYKALTKVDFAGEGGHPRPMRRAIAFAKSIAASKTVAAEFGRVAADWRASIETTAAELAETMPPLEVSVEHVDGGFNAKARDRLLSWLKADTVREDQCRILTNARCLSEGVDVPALDAVLFLHPRKSQIDVVQAVGRVMRRAPDKELGYVILPVGIPAGVAPEDALNNNEKYRVVWQILNALRSHDERLDATINKIELGVDPGDRIEIIAVANELPARPQSTSGGIGIGGEGGAGDTDPGDERPTAPGPAQGSMAFQFDEVSRAIMARIVKKCGTRTYWEEWARDVAGIAQAQVTRITAIVETPDSEERAAFELFLAEIRDDLNDSITEPEAIEMLAQHLITRPVFEALFEGYDFAASNPVSRALEGVLAVLDRHNLDRESEGLERFYASVRTRAAGIDSAAAKQKIVLELYDKFFKTAFPTLSKKLGIVYTPVEIVDFIIHSVDEALRSSFGQSLASEGVHIIDPFTGTGTFITRLLQSGLIPPDQLARKYAHEIHANEIVLLAYYIAAINIEATFHELSGGDYLPFPGICLTDTFQLYEKDDLVAEQMRDNSGRRTRQKALDIRVIIGNPPYSDGQDSANDNAANVAYPHLDARVRDTYAARSGARNKNGLYNSYIRAMRWASDRIGDRGIVSFVTNGGWVDGNSADGIRRCLQEEFADLYIFHLKGNQRTSGERSRREGGKIFDAGSRAPIAVWLFIKNPDAEQHGRIHFHTVDDYLTREAKLAEVAHLGSMQGVGRRWGWRVIEPDAHGDWLGQRDAGFADLMAMGDKDGKERVKLFASYSAGVKTQRDWWAYNPSRAALAASIGRMIDTYNAEVQRFDAAHPKATRKEREALIGGFIDLDAKRISWSDGLKMELVRGKVITFDQSKLVRSLYRPFCPQYLYYDGVLNERTYQMPSIFPAGGCNNRAIMIKMRTDGSGSFALMIDRVPDLQSDGGSQCFPLWIYEPVGPDADLAAGELFGEGERQYRRRPGITPGALDAYRSALGDAALSHEAMFYYSYGLLHAPDYRLRFADTLAKELPRLPVPTGRAIFDAFERAGRELAELHCGFESVEPFPVTLAQGDLRLINIPDPVVFWRVEKMRFGGKQGAYDRSVIHYNHNLTLTGVPLEAYDYVVNGKSAIEWVMEWQGVRTDTASGITKDANAYAREEKGDPRYPFDLLARVIAMSLRTREIVAALPSWQG